MKNTEGKKKSGKAPKKAHEELHTESPISEKDEVKKAEERLRRRSGHK